MQNHKFLVTGASGFIGRALTSYLEKEGHLVSRLVRHPNQNEKNIVTWNPSREEVHLNEFEGFDVVIHLAGENIGKGSWSEKKKEAIFLSRARDTWLLSHVLTRLVKPPHVFFSASAVGYYGSRGDLLLTEEVENCKGGGFLSDLCARWEKATEILAPHRTRVIIGRFGVVISPQGGVVARLMPIFQRRLGARLGNGSQWMSWIALEDLVRAILFTVTHQNLSGVFNLVSPYPVTNLEFTETLAQTVHRTPLFSIPSWVLKLMFGEKGRELLLASQRVIPKKLLESGFIFNKERLSESLII